jgi:hypothetical protein
MRKLHKCFLWNKCLCHRKVTFHSCFKETDNILLFVETESLRIIKQCSIASLVKCFFHVLVQNALWYFITFYKTGYERERDICQGSVVSCELVDKKRLHRRSIFLLYFMGDKALGGYTLEQ